MTGDTVRVTEMENGGCHSHPPSHHSTTNDSDQEILVAVSNKLEYDALLGLDVALVRKMIPEGGEEIRQGTPRRYGTQ